MVVIKRRHETNNLIFKNAIKLKYNKINPLLFVGKQSAVQLRFIIKINKKNSVIIPLKIVLIIVLLLLLL